MDFTKQIITKNAKETAEVGERLAFDLKPSIICLYGDLGSGKTTFTQGIARGLGITTRLLSPTFIIVRRYEIPNSEIKLYHIDLYRLENFEGLGLQEIFSDRQAIVVIEWAEKLGGALPKKRTDIYFSTLPDEKHTITIK